MLNSIRWTPSSLQNATVASINGNSSIPILYGISSSADMKPLGSGPSYPYEERNDPGSKTTWLTAFILCRTSKNRTRRGPYCTGVCFRNFFDQNVNQRAITASIHNNALKRATAQSQTVWMNCQPTSGPQSQSNHAGCADMKTRYKVHWKT